MRNALGVAALVSLAGCASASPSSSDPAADAGKDAPIDAPGDVALPARGTFAEIYAAYLAPDAPVGHCAQSACHGSGSRGGFFCGTKDECYRSMTHDVTTDGATLVDLSAPARSLVVDPARSPLVWFNPNGGRMPADNGDPDEAAKQDIAAWIAAGATND